MKKYSDEDIKSFKKISCKIAGDYLGIAPMGVAIGLRNNKLPFGYAVNKGSKWSYYIIADRLVAYKNGTLDETSLVGVEDKLNKIIENFSSFKDELITILKYKK